MVPISQVYMDLERKLKSISPGEGINVLTYKKDRGFIVTKITDTIYSLEEYGYFREDFNNLDERALKKVIKKVLKREFPRSNTAKMEFINRQ